MTDLAHWLRLDGTTPAAVWVLVVAQLVLLAGAALVMVRRRGWRKPTDTAKRGTTALLVIGLIFATVVLGAFMIGTFEGATAFAHDRLGWDNWRKVLPWGALDAGSMTFSLFGIRAVILGRDPRQALRLVYTCGGFSAFIQLIQGGSGHYWQAGLFLAFLALLGNSILHVIKDQISPAETTTSYLKNPPFAIRWLTSPASTVCAWLAWHNFPAAEGTKPTVINALANLEQVRADKMARLLARPAAPRWAVLAPRRYARQLRTAHAEATARAAREAARADELATALIGAQDAVQALRAEFGDTLRSTAQNALAEGAQMARAEAAQELRAAAQTYRAEGAQAARAEAAQQIEDLRGQLAAARKGAAQTAGATSTPKAKQQQVTHLRDDDEVADGLWDSFCAHMEDKGEPMSRYRVQITAPTNSRQAERVVALLVRRWADKFADGSAQSAAQVGAQGSAQSTAQTSRAESDDQEDDRAEATG